MTRRRRNRTYQPPSSCSGSPSATTSKMSPLARRLCGALMINRRVYIRAAERHLDVQAPKLSAPEPSDTFLDGDSAA